MIVTDKPNPFFVLALPVDASRADIVARGQELVDTAETKEAGYLYRWAMEQLITNPQTRLEYEVFEVPDTQYEDGTWESFARAHRKKPVDMTALTTQPPQAEDINLAALMRLFLEELLTLSEPDLDTVLNGSPFIPVYQLPLEVEDVIFG